MPGDLGAVAAHDDFVEGDTDLDTAANKTWVDRIIVGVDTDVVIAGQPRREPPRHTGPTAGKLIIEPRSSKIASDGRTRVVAWMRLLARRNQLTSCRLKSATSSKWRPGRKLVSK